MINALTTKTHLFDNYVAIDPSLWWDSPAYLEYADSILSAGDFTNKGLYVGIANTMTGEMNIDNVERDTAINTTHIRSILKFVKSQDGRKDGIQFGWKYYEEDTHSSVPLIAEYDALRFLFSWYQLKDKRTFYEGSLPIEESIELLSSHYENVSAKMGYEILPNEGLVNSFGYYNMSQKRLKMAAAFFDLNILNYPNSTNVFDSRGDCYLAAGDSLKALEFFKKLLEIGDSDLLQEKIDMLADNLGK